MKPRPPMRADNSRHVIAAAQRRAEQTRQRAVAALRRMDAAGQRISFDSVSREAGVSRSWLYAQDLRAEIERLRARHPATAPAPVPPRIRRLEADNQQLRDALARALGERRRAGVLGQVSGRDTPKSAPPKLIGPR